MKLFFDIRRILFTAFFLFIVIISFGQKPQSIFKWFGFEDTDSFRLTKPLRFYDILCSKTGEHKFSSTFGLIRDKGLQIELLLYAGSDNETKRQLRNYAGEDGIKSMFESPAKIVFFAAHDNRIFWQPSDDGGIGFSPFQFPPTDKPDLKVSKIWIDSESDIYIGTCDGDLYYIKRGGAMSAYDGKLDSAGNFIVTKGEKLIRRIPLWPHALICAIEQDPVNKNILWIGTDAGLFSFDKTTMLGKNILKSKERLTITQIEADSTGNLWLSTLENGMAYFNNRTSSVNFFNGKRVYPIKTFCRKSINEFFVGLVDSIPAIFNTSTGNYTFIQDSIFKKTADSTSDIKLDGFGNLLVVKGGGLFYTDYYKESKRYAKVPLEKKAYAPFITEIMVMGIPYRAEGNPRGLKSIRLKHNQNSLTIDYSLMELIDKKNVQFAWMVEGYVNEWVVPPVSGTSIIPANLNGLTPGKYIFRLKAKVGDEPWRAEEARLEIIIVPPLWQLWWFWAGVIVVVSSIVYLIVKLRVRSVRRTERLKASYQKELLELEAKALRAQMNPHFVFNSLNSIKALMQQNQNEKGVTYLTTFSKLIRTLFNNADKKEITLYDEIETCKFYLQLEAMRFDGKFSYIVETDSIDLKAIHVPALIVQPFIENAIWHGIIPRGAGKVSLIVSKENGDVQIIIDDDDIGREVSQQNKSASGIIHESKGVNLTQSRLKLDSLLQQRKAGIKIIDKKDENGKAAGTRVIISLTEDS